MQDRSIYEDARIFAPNLHAMGLMTHRDFSNYSAVFELMESLVKGPREIKNIFIQHYFLTK